MKPKPAPRHFLTRIPKAYWLVGLLLASVIAVSFATISALTKVAGYYERAINETGRYKHQASNEIHQRCVAIAAAKERTGCEQKARDAAREQERIEYETAAQLATATWAQVTGILALTGAVLSAGGIFLVWTTYQETKRSNKIAHRESARNTRRAISSADDTRASLAAANQSAEAMGAVAQNMATFFREAQSRAEREMRPYLSFDGVKVKGAIFRDTDVVLKIRNYGRLPARNLRLEQGTDWASIPVDRIPDPRDGVDMLTDVLAGGQGFGQIVDVTRIPAAEWNSMIARSATCLLKRVRIYYETGIGQDDFIETTLVYRKPEIDRGEIEMLGPGLMTEELRQKYRDG